MGGEVLTDKQKEIQLEIDAIQIKINDINLQVTNDTALVASDQKLIDGYEAELVILKEKLQNVINTHQSVYDELKGKLNDIKEEIKICNDRNKPRVSKEDTDLMQSKSQLEAQVAQIITDTNKLIDEIAPYDVDILMFGGYIIAIQRDTGIINDEIIKLTKIKDDNILKTEELNKIIKELDKTILELEIKIYGNIVDNNQNLLNLSEKTDISLNYLFSYLKKNLSSDVIYDKIESRDREHEHLYNKNKLFDILFYCFYFSFLLIMISTQNIKREHFLIYLFVGLIPFIYPFLFKWVLYLIRYLSNDTHGPKNAFIDINNTLIAYNET